MIVKPGQIASKRVRREARYENLLQGAALDAVFAARSATEFSHLVDLTVYQTGQYGHLPQYRRVAVQAYALGAMHAMYRMQGIPIPQPAKEAKPAKPKRKPRAKKGSVSSTPIEVQSAFWLRPQEGATILPPAYRSPFPPAADLKETGT